MNPGAQRLAFPGGHPSKYLPRSSFSFNERATELALVTTANIHMGASRWQVTTKADHLHLFIAFVFTLRCFRRNFHDLYSFISVCFLFNFNSCSFAARQRNVFQIINSNFVNAIINVGRREYTGRRWSIAGGNRK